MNEPVLSAKAACLVESLSDCLYQRNADQPLPPGSLTKLLTAYAALWVMSTARLCRVGKAAIAVQQGNEDSSAGLVLGETRTVGSLLYGMLLPSGNDAAVALAEAAGGTAMFLETMRFTALRLGLRDTRCTNVYGDDEDQHYSTARNLAWLSTIVTSQPFLGTIVGTKHVTIGGHEWANTNKLLTLDPTATGVKTGTTPAAGACLAFSANRGGRCLVGVVLGCPDDDSRYADARTLLDWGFANG